MYMGLDNNTGVSDVPGPWASNGSLLEVECQYGWVYEDADIETTITMEVCMLSVDHKNMLMVEYLLRLILSLLSLRSCDFSP